MHQDRLRCRHAPNAAGSWYRWLYARLVCFTPERQALDAARYSAAIPRAARPDGTVWLNTARIEHAARTGPAPVVVRAEVRYPWEQDFPRTA